MDDKGKTTDDNLLCQTYGTFEAICFLKQMIVEMLVGFRLGLINFTDHREAGFLTE